MEQCPLTIPTIVRKTTTAKQKNAKKAFALISGCRDCSNLTVSSPPMMNMNVVSGEKKNGGSYMCLINGEGLCMV